MRYFLFLTLSVLAFLFLFSAPTEAKLAECDACGYCQGQQAPENWSSCAQCLYPNIVGTTDLPTDNETLQIYTGAADPNNPGNILQNKPPQPAQGKYYTQLGCLDTGLLSFRDNPAAAGALTNFILNNLLFPIAGTLAFGVIVYGAFMLLTAQGDQMRIAQGKRLITSSIIGIVFTFSSVFIITFIASDVLKIPGFSKGTRVTFVGYGTPTNEAGTKVYPELTVFLDGNEVAKIEGIQGTAANPITKEVYLPVNLNLSDPADVQRVTMSFTNDVCLTRQSTTPGECCYYTLSGVPATRQYVPPYNPNCLKNEALYNGDRNIYNTRLLFDDRICINRKNNRGNQTSTDGLALHNLWQGAYYQCTAVAP